VWLSGVLNSAVTSSASGGAVMAVRTVPSQAARDFLMPLGRPLLPLVNMTSARSSGFQATGSPGPGSSHGAASTPPGTPPNPWPTSVTSLSPASSTARATLSWSLYRTAAPVALRISSWSAAESIDAFDPGLVDRR
jgi:hypothetical protein